jgi:hypothetical protein
VAFGLVFVAANTVRLVLTEFPVSHSPVQLAESVSDSVSEKPAPTTISQALQIPIAASAPIAGAAESGASVDRAPASAQLQVVSSDAAQSGELAQPAAAPAKSGAADTPGERNKPSLQVERKALALTNAQPETPSPVSESQEGTSQLFREFLEWQSNKAKPQVQQQRFLHSSKRIARPNASPSHLTIVPNAAIKRTSSSSRTRDDIGRGGPSDSKDSDRRS